LVGRELQGASGPGQITCVLADAYPAVIGTIERILADHQIVVVATATDGDDALAAIRQHQPTIAMLDPKLGGLDIIEVAREAPTTRLLVYTSYQAREQLLEEVDAGVAGIVLKEAPLSDVPRAIETILAGGTYIDPLLARAFVDKNARRMLTARERSVLQLLADGHRHETISQTLSITPDTVRAHLRNAMHKLGSSTRTQAVAEALRRTLIT
jgi:two-component system, NarL family, response regulator DesR